MPSPTIPRSCSDPFISSKTSSRNRLPSSNRSVCSARSSKSSYWLAWSNINKLGSLVVRQRKSTDSSSKHSDLTEESLEAHNRRQEAILLQSHNINLDIDVDDKNAKCSPYYKGLIDASLIINRERHHPSSIYSPGRESHATTVATSSTSLSSLLVKMYEWSSCFSFSFKSSSSKNNNNRDRENNGPASALPPAGGGGGVAAASFSSISSTLAARITSKDAPFVMKEEKPLRERVSECKPPSASSSERATSPERQYTWANKYQPKALGDFICNRDKATQLQSLMRDVDCSHFIFEGPPGVGKRTMIWAMLHEAFGADKVQIREECKAFNLKGEAISSIKVRVKASSQHVEVNLSDLKGYEKHVIVELIKETHNKLSNKALPSKLDSCRAIILYEADKLSSDALLYIKWLLERYKGYTKFFFCCRDVSKLQPIEQLCSVVRLAPPSSKEIVEVLEFIAKQEGIELPRQLAEKIADDAKNNLRQAIRSFEASWQRSYPFAEDQAIMTGWEDDITNIAKNMIQEQSPKQLYNIRGKLQNLIEHDVSPEFIFKSLVAELKKLLDEPFQLQINNLYEHYNRDDGNILDGENVVIAYSQQEETGRRLHDPARKKVHHFMRIEEFIAKFMSFYKSSVIMNETLQHDTEA